MMTEIPWSEQYKQESCNHRIDKGYVFVPGYEKAYISNRLGVPQSMIYDRKVDTEKQVWVIHHAVN